MRLDTDSRAFKLWVREQVKNNKYLWVIFTHEGDITIVAMDATSINIDQG